MARISQSPKGSKNTKQLARLPRLLYVEPSKKVCSLLSFFFFFNTIEYAIYSRSFLET